jgi:long-chain fatty acid transport protein
MPKVDAKITNEMTGNSSKESSDDKVYSIPAIGISSPINPKLRFGISAYGVSGLGVDYRGTDLSIPDAMGPGNDQKAEIATQLQVMKFAPNLAYLVNDNLSLGLGIPVNYSALDLGAGTSFGYGVGAQLGLIWKAMDMISVGATYTTTQSVNHENVMDSDGDGLGDENLKLASPQQFGVGVAYEQGPILVEVDGKWINWANAEGYDDFDWEDQYVVALGAQYKPNKKFAVRAGYNYGNNPVKDHDGDWSENPADTVDVQGVDFAEANYEYLRIIGFPAIVEQHITLGIGYEFSPKFAVNLGYMYALEETIESTSKNDIITYESSLSEQSLELGLTWRF